MTDKTSLGNRMKAYEYVPRIYLTPRMPTILRIDGKSFHNYTKGFEKPWDKRIINAFVTAATALMKEIQGAKIAYCQSDEISILINDYEKFETSSWFDKNVQKMCSVSASVATAGFNLFMRDVFETKVALFDARCFVIPREDVVNYFHWRQADAVRNSISGLAQKHFSHKQLHQKNTGQMQEMLFHQKNINWNDCKVFEKRGWCVLRETKEVEPEVMRTFIEPDWNVPTFSQDRDYIGKYLEQKEE